MIQSTQLKHLYESIHNPGWYLGRDHSGDYRLFNGLKWHKTYGAEVEYGFTEDEFSTIPIMAGLRNEVRELKGAEK